MKTLETMPEIIPYFEGHYRAFLQCRVTQPSGFGIERISLQSIESWCNLNGIGVDERGEFAVVITALDDVFLDHQKNKDKATTK